MNGAQGEKLTLLSLRARRGYLLTLALAIALSAGAGHGALGPAQRDTAQRGGGLPFDGGGVGDD